MTSSLRDLLDWLWKFIAKLLTIVVTGKNLPTRTDKVVKREVQTNDPEMAVGHETRMTEAPVQDAETLLKNEQAVDILAISDEVEYLEADGKVNRKRGGSETEGANMVVATPNNNESSGDEVNEATEVNSQESYTYPDEVNANLPSNDGEDTQRSANEEENRMNDVEVENAGEREPTVTFSLPGEDAGAVGTQQTEDANNVETVSAEERDRRDRINEDDVSGYYENHDVGSTEDPKVPMLLKLSSRVAYHEVLAPQYYILNFKTAAQLPMESVHTALKQLRRLIPWLGLGLKRHKRDMWICLYPEDHVDYPVVDDDQLWNAVSNAREQFNYMENGCLSTFRILKSQLCTQCQTPAVGTEASTPSKISCETTSACSAEPNAATSGRRAFTEHIFNPTSSRCVNADADATGVERITSTFDTNANFTTAMADSDPSKDTSEPHESVVPTLIPPSDNVSNDPLHSVCHSENDNSVDSLVNTSPASSSPLIKSCKETTNKTHYYRLIFGIPRPLADETSAQYICDTFIKELNRVISGTCEDNVSGVERSISCEGNDNQTGSQNNCDTVVPNSDCNNGALTENCPEQVKNENIKQSSAGVNSDGACEKDSDAIKACMQQQITAIESAFISHEKFLDENDKSNTPSNKPDPIDRNSPYIERKLEMPHTKNFINKCKTLRVNFVSGFATCVNVAVANCLVKYGHNKEDQDVKIGHNIAIHYNFEDLSEWEWQDNDNSNESDEAEVRGIDCCMPATATLNIKASDWHNGFWERVQEVHQNRLDMLGAAANAFPQKIPHSIESEIKDETFASVNHPSATLSIASIHSHALEFPRQMEQIESISYQELSSVIIFLRTHNITLNIHEDCLRFSCYNQGQFVPHQTAHDFADDILSVLRKSLVS